MLALRAANLVTQLELFLSVRLGLDFNPQRGKSSSFQLPRPRRSRAAWAVESNYIRHPRAGGDPGNCY